MFLIGGSQLLDVSPDFYGNFGVRFRPIAVISALGDARRMRSMTIAALLLSMGGCSEQISEAYSTYADAERAGAISRGWVPAFVPSSAHDIEDSHDLDTNRQTLRFTVPPSEVGQMAASLRAVSAKDQKAANELSTKHRLGASSKVYLICSKPLNGVLAVDRESGRSVYDTTVGWADDDCV